jgi:hypothetical protein
VELETVVTTLLNIACALSIVVALHTAINLMVVIRPKPARVLESVSILIPARNESANIANVITSALAQKQIVDLQVIVLDDNSTDDTLEIASKFSDSRLHVIASTEEPPEGWHGKAWACQRLANATASDILVFIDADVTLQSEAVCSAINAMSEYNLALVSPFPRQETTQPLTRLIQPLLQWSWLSAVPLFVARRFTIPTLAVANGQFIVCRKSDYIKVGGHESVKGAVVEDIELARQFSRHKLRNSVADGSKIASCLMYPTDRELIDGYSKNAWSAFNGIAGSLAVNAAMLFVYVFPLIGFITGHPSIAALTLSVHIASRLLIGKATSARVWPEVVLHPVAICIFCGINVLSWIRHMRGTNTWKGRTV